MLLNKINGELTWSTLPVPTPLPGQVLIRVMACGICRTDLHIIDGELTSPKLPLIPGHEVIGTVVSAGDKTSGLHEGDVVGVPWLGYACGECRYCLRGQENLCNRAIFTGYTMNGGFAEFMVAFSDFCIKLPAQFAFAQYAPFLCAGLIGYRSYRFIPAGFSKIGLYGFGAAAHIIAQLAVMQGKKIYAFTRKGDDAAGKFALSLGAAWAGGSDESSPEKLDAAIIFAPAGELIPKALSDCDRGGIVVCGGIHMSDIPSFPYSILWEERQVRSVANLTRKDAEEFMAAAAVHTPHTSVELFPLEQANSAIRKFREGKITGAAVLVMPPGNVRST
ncbi:MAG TPA: zinc-dependent alcohol dehydrogenase family protein [Chitinophagaceae bacterium]|nr:zinc-dependent alcohol dehydrogenase family protein [Chitinophagaceae bacterium]